MLPSFEPELRAHATALRALARDLVGEHDADDLVQETALQLLRSPPRRPGALGAWFTTVLRRLAYRHRRSLRRRRKHEGQVAPATTGEPPDRVLEHSETLRCVTGALLALPLPYRSVLLLRYFEDLAPTAIAARTGEPLATVKSRLQRGLAQLRARLDRDGEQDWRRGLALAFGLERTGTVGAATATTGVLLMGTGAKLWLGGAAVLACAATFLIVESVPQAAMTPSATRSDPPPIVSDVGAEARTMPVPIDRREAAVMSLAAAKATLTTLRGRCIDEGGSPLAGVRVHVSTRPGVVRYPPKAGDLDRPKSVDLVQTSTADGRFEFIFAPPTSVDVSIQDKKCLPISATLSDLQPGAEADLGDLMLHPGALARGRVIDTEGMPIVGAEVHLQLADDAKSAFGDFRQWTLRDPRTQADGSFVGKMPWLPGDYRVIVASEVIERGDRLTIPPGISVVDHDILVRKRSDLETISGVVVDGNDRPLEGVLVSGGAPSLLLNTDAAGRFAIVRQEGDRPEGVELWLLKDGYEKVTIAKQTPWGSRDLRFTMRAGLALKVSVVTDDDRPVEDFAIRVFPQFGAQRVQSSDDYKVRSKGRHENGVVRITGLQRGPSCVFIEPADGELAVSTGVPIEIAENGQKELEVRLVRARTRMLRVQRADGSPVAGGRVQFVDTLGQAFSIDTYARSLDQWMTHTGPDKVLLLQEATTDARGELLLRGPGNGTLGLLLLGPGHRSQIVRDVVMATDEPLVVTVANGARLTGTVRPLDVVQELRQSAGPSVPPGFRLMRDLGT